MSFKAAQTQALGIRTVKASSHTLVEPQQLPSASKALEDIFRKPKGSMSYLKKATTRGHNCFPVARD